MDWFKKHADTITILSAFALCFWTMNEKMNDGFRAVSKEIANLDKEITIIKTVMIMRNIMPSELANKDEK